MDTSGNSALVLFLILLADLAITCFHSYQEWKGVGGPIWRNFGAIAGFDIPDQVGFWVFTALLTLLLFAIGFVGIVGPLGQHSTAAALGVLIGARLSDTIVSHALLYTVGYRPNPGLVFNATLCDRGYIHSCFFSRSFGSCTILGIKWIWARSHYICGGIARVAGSTMAVAHSKAKSLV